MKDTIELTIESKYEFVELVGSVTKNVTEMIGFDEDAANWIELAIREVTGQQAGARLAALAVVLREVRAEELGVELDALRGQQRAQEILRLVERVRGEPAHPTMFTQA